MNKLIKAIEDLSSTFAREGVDGEFTIKVSSDTFTQLCWEIQKYSGKYMRTHKDNSREVGYTVYLELNTSYGKVYIYMIEIDVDVPSYLLH